MGNERPAPSDAAIAAAIAAIRKVMDDFTRQFLTNPTPIGRHGVNLPAEYATAGLTAALPLLYAQWAVVAEMPPDTVTGPLFAAIRDFREWLAGPPAPDEQVRTWKICTPEQQWSGGVWCAEPDCGCVAESSEIGNFREADWTLAELHAAIGAHIATQAEGRADTLGAEQEEGDRG